MKFIALIILSVLISAEETIASFNGKDIKSDPDWYQECDVKFYKIDIEASDTIPYIAGNTTILSQVAINLLDTFRFELSSDITIDSVYIDNNHKVSPIRSGDIVKVPLPNTAKIGQLLSVTVYYKGSVASNGFFSPLSSKRDNTWNIPVTWTLSEPFGAKQWFPCKQYLPDKADSAWIFITIPKNCKAGSNGILTGITPIGSDKVRYEWKTRYPLAYYQLSFSVADYKDYSFYTRLNDHDSVLVQNYIYNRPNYLENNKDAINKTDAFLKYYSSTFGIYPFWKEKYGHCVAPIGGGMEHQTMTTLANFGSMLVAHELAHQWFGNSVTCATWQDIWINEGFASYAEYLASDELESHEKAINWMKEAHQEALSNPEGSVFVPQSDKNNELRIFNSSLTYKKGAAIIHMLRYELNNDELFFNILRQFLTEYKNSIATGQDFLKVVNELSNKDFSWFFDQWYYGKGNPEFDLSWKVSNNMLTLSSNQKPISASVPFFKMHFDLKLAFKNGDTMVRLYQDQPQKIFKILVDKNVDSIQFDPQEWLLKNVTINKVPDLPSFDDYFQASPIPFSEELNIRFKSEPEKDRIIKVVDLNGNIILEQKTKKKIEITLNTNKLIPGVYLIYVLDGNKKYIRKVIKVK